MLKTGLELVKNLSLDLANFRTIEQSDELGAVRAMVSVSPDRFWALMESLLNDGYLPTENIIVLKAASEIGGLVVKEGNRRVAALKIIHGYMPHDAVGLPEELSSRIGAIPESWKTANREIPCSVFGLEDAATVDRIVALAHGKGEKAGRDQWNAVARARHNRRVNHAAEPALDLLELFLRHGEPRTPDQINRWSGDYPLSVLDEALKKIFPHFRVASVSALVAGYSSDEFKPFLDLIVRGVGSKKITFKLIRSDRFASEYAPDSVDASQGGRSDIAGGTDTEITRDADSALGNLDVGGAKAGEPEATRASRSTQSVPAPATGTRGKKLAVSISDPKSVGRGLRQLSLRGHNRQKIVALRDEAIKLDLSETPIAFCFLLRSIFELSAKAYCEDHGISWKGSNGNDKPLAGLLTLIVNCITSRDSDKDAVRRLHGARVELEKASGLLSVTSMNQLVHNSSFSIPASDLPVIFNNVLPLLVEMNR